MAKVASKQFHGVGRRKKSVARVYISAGNGNITINGVELDKYFPMETLQTLVKSPLTVTETEGKYDVKVNVYGGGYSGQAGAIRHGISRALLKSNEDYKNVLALRYISGFTWADICEKLYISRATVHRWHDKAVEILVIPKIETQ